MNKGYLNTEIGILMIEEDKGFITAIKLVDEMLIENKSKEIEECKKQLIEYFEGRRKKFTFKYIFNKGTDFQRKVWMVLENIKYGEIKSYKEIAILVGNEKSCRAVGGAVNKNPLAIVVPCHRVCGSKGDLVGYAYGVEKKKKLIDIENGLN